MNDSGIDIESKVDPEQKKIDNQYIEALNQHVPISPLVNVNVALDCMIKPKIINKVVTCNLLSPYYAKQDWYPHVKPDDLDFEKRVPRVIKLINEWMDENCIICLQELSEQWLDVLKPIFEDAQYSLCSELYANGKMGVGIAFPIHQYTLAQKQESFLCGTYIGTLVKRLRILESKKKCVLDRNIMRELKDAAKSVNPVLTVLLKNYDGEKILVATYHMPCCYDKNYFFAAHIHSAKTGLNLLKNKYNADTVILTGDFNIKSTSPEYKLLVGNEFTQEELLTTAKFIASLQTVYDYIKLKLTAGTTFNSAHVMQHGKEPPYTNISIKE